MDLDTTRLDPLPSRELAAFVAAVETGRLGAAADSLSLTQSAVTKRVQSLERRLDETLLVRSSGGVKPTVAGTALYPEVKEALAALARGARAVAGARRNEPMLPLAASHTIGEFVLPDWLAAFRLGTPDARPRVEVTNSRGVLEAVREGDVDIGLLPAGDSFSGFDSIRIGEDELVVVVACQHRWSGARSIAPADLRSEPFFTREEGSCTRAAAIAAARDLGVELEPTVELGSTQALKRSVLSGGFTIISSLVIAEETRSGTLHVLRLRGADLRRSFFAIRRPRATIRQVARRFWEWLDELPE